MQKYNYTDAQVNKNNTARSHKIGSPNLHGSSQDHQNEHTQPR